MKMRTLLASVVSVLLLASCGTAGNPDSVIKGFEDSFKGTAQISFNQKYDVDVISEKGGMDGFKHKVDDKTIADVDLTEGDLYLYVKRDAKDMQFSEDVTTKEALVAKNTDGYFYVTSTMENPVKLDSEAAAKAKIDELLKKTSYNFAGYIDSSSLHYPTDGTYEHTYFGLGTSNIEVADFMETPTYEVTKEKGLKVTNSLGYIGYKTDGGISDFPGADGKPAATYEITTDAKGNVLGYSETLDASLAMQIMNPAPQVTIKGTKTLSNKLNTELTKKTDIAHQLTKAVLSVPTLTQGTVEVFTAPTMDGELTKAKDGDKIVVGQYLVLKVTPAGKNTIRNVSVNDDTLLEPNKDDLYYFEIPEGEAKIGINFIGADVVENVKYGTISVTAPEQVEVASIWFTLVNGQPDAMKELINGNKVPVGKDNWVGLKLTVAEGYTLTKAQVNGADMMEIMGQKCFSVKEEIEYNVVIEVEKAGEQPQPSTKPVAVLPETVKGGSVAAFTCKMGDFQNMKPVKNGDELVEGDILALKLTCEEGYEVKLAQVNEKDVMIPVAQAGGFYCYKIVAGENNVVVKFSNGTEPVAVIPETFEGGKVSVFTCKMGDFGNMTPVKNGDELVEGNILCVKITPNEGQEVKVAQVNEKDVMIPVAQAGGFYCFNIVAGANTLVVTFQAVAA